MQLRAVELQQPFNMQSCISFLLLCGLGVLLTNRQVVGECMPEEKIDDIFQTCIKENSDEKQACRLPCALEKMGMMTNDGRVDIDEIEKKMRECGTMDDNKQKSLGCLRKKEKEVTVSKSDCKSYLPFSECMRD